MSIHNKRVIGAKHAHSGHERAVSDDDIISTQDSVDLIVWRRFPSDQQPGLIQLNCDISRKHWRHWEGQETKETKGVRSRNTPYTRPRRESNLYLQLCARPLPSSVETGQLNNPLRCRKEGNLEEPHPWNVFSEFPMWPFRRGKKCGAQVDATFLWRGLAVTNAHSCYFCYLKLKNPSEPKKRGLDKWIKAAGLSCGFTHPESEANNSHAPPSVVSPWIHVVTGDAPTSLLQDTLRLYRVTASSPGTSWWNGGAVTLITRVILTSPSLRLTSLTLDRSENR